MPYRSVQTTASGLDFIPEHLREYVTEQDSKLYTYIDHAAWRYIMRVSKAFFGKTAHPLYLHGLDATGIATERIPLVSEMDEALKKMGWRAVPINGFIPPAVFLEFQALKILAIACDMRKLENLGYTPSPDIVHEAAGHAPIVADPGYRTYLEAYGEVAKHAVISKYDVELYDAIFKLSEIKEDPHSSAEQIQAAQNEFEAVAKREVEPSEVALLTRMAWWTTEYGLIGSLDDPKIYGAGLLSSVSESYNCLKPGVKKIPFSLEATIGTSYDITRPQPQLFVAQNFQELTQALQTFANSMAFRRGGVYGLEVAKKAQNTVTITLDTGAQIVGTVLDYEVSPDDGTSAPEEASFTLTGAKQIAFHDQAHAEITHSSLPQKLYVGLFDRSVSAASSQDLQRKLHTSGLHTKSGHRILGRFKKEAHVDKLGRVFLLEQVKVMDPGGKVVYQESEKHYPLLLGNRVISVSGGAADRREFAMRNTIRTKKVDSHKSNLTQENTVLNDLYREVRQTREQGGWDATTPSLLDRLTRQLDTVAPEDWLLRLELLELYAKVAPHSVVAAQIRNQLKQISESSSETKDLIDRGLELIT
jgi:phenylalanine-4-hydroxylase